MFSERAHLTQEGPIFLERDGTTFKELLNYLHRDRLNLPMFSTAEELELFRKELEFWELYEDLDRLNAEHPKQNPQSANKGQSMTGPFPDPLLTMLGSEPESQSADVRAQWLKLKPLDLFGILTKHPDSLPADKQLIFG
mmetsp:Transcript_24349/g.37690  ORF Transcript_24349/g.37690 Transcript_24349/m.37690 type:complete len:139 (+) Transcript_24349:684-1100(+)